jgi:CMP/dCMP kinase
LLLGNILKDQLVKHAKDINQVNVVTIDGPAASGKSSVSRELALRLGWSWVSTGAFYRGLAFVADQSGSNLDNEAELVQLAKTASWHVFLAPDQTRIEFHGRDVTEEIGKEAVGGIASKISSYPLVREALLAAQRKCASGPKSLIAEGRDCGTVVFPKAFLKIFLTARAEDRAARRALEEGLEAESLIQEQKRRDSQDANRKVAPMQASEDSLTIDTSQMTLEEVVDQIETEVRLRLSKASVYQD